MKRNRIFKSSGTFSLEKIRTEESKRISHMVGQDIP